MGRERAEEEEERFTNREVEPNKEEGSVKRTPGSSN